MTGEKRTETRMRCYNTLCIPYISLHDPPYSHIRTMHAERGGVIYREYTECYINYQTLTIVKRFDFHHTKAIAHRQSTILISVQLHKNFFLRSKMHAMGKTMLPV